MAGVAVVSITSHEAAHGFVADRLGDPTARERGRLTLNPIPHIDLFFTILLPLVPHPFRFGFHLRRGEAGSGGRLAVEKPAAGLGARGSRRAGDECAHRHRSDGLLSAATLMGLANTSSSLTEILAVGIFLNALLAVFNLIPIPPLDGSSVVQYFLSGEALVLYRRLEQFGLLIIMALVFFVPQLQIPLSAAIFGLVELITTPFGVMADVEPLLRSLLFK